MYSFSFPTMIHNNSAVLVADKAAVKSNLKLLFSAEKRELMGDPYFGTLTKHVLFEQANSIISDLLIDEIYTDISTFMPQIFLTRKDITLEIKENTQLLANIRYVYLKDNTSDMYTILLTNIDN